MAKNSSPFSALSQDLTMEIFQRLPVKYLLRSKSVSKTWCSLISNPNFTKSHFNHALAKSDLTVIVHKLSQNINDNPSISLLHVDSGRLITNFNYPCPPAEFSSVQNSLLVGSDNGLVCVCIGAASDRYSSPFVSRNTKTYIWNPATKQSRLIPPCSLRENKIQRNSAAYGFGYDPTHNDFKVVRVLSPVYCAEVYSLKDDAWKVLDNPIDVPYDDAFDVSVNGILFATGSEGSMVMFDLSYEVSNCAIQLPVETFDAHFIDINGSVGIVLGEDMESDSDGGDEDLKSIIRLWKLDDDACLRDGQVEASWTLMFKLDLQFLSVNFVHGYFSGELLVLIDGMWFLIDKDTKHARRIPVLMNTRQVFKYTESLASIPGSQQVLWNN